MTLRGKMHALYASLLFVLTGAQKLLGEQFDDLGPRRMGNYRVPVPFGHIYKEGFENPFSELNQPRDLLDLRLRIPKNEEEIKTSLQQGKRLIKIKRTEQITSRDAFLQPDINVNEDRTNVANRSDDYWPKLPDLAAIQLRNAMSPRHRATRKEKKQVLHEAPNLAQGEQIPKDRFFVKGGFELIQDHSKLKSNWTKCEELGNKDSFRPRDIVDIEWVPFYVWSIRPMRQAVIHKFSYPTEKLVKQYYESYHFHLNKTVDWQQPKLLMTGMNEMLLIAVNKKGSFVGISKQLLPSSIKDIPVMIPTLNIRLQIQDPYLLVVFCKDFYATIMAVSGDEPGTYKDKIAEAAAVGFKGLGRPLWRDVRAEEAVRESELRQKLLDEEDKMIRISEEVPPMY